jgi:TRAP-type C4-dicarboxylate transport system permease large subunit
MTPIIALVVYMAAIVIWNFVLKRNIGEAMLVGLAVVTAFAGADALTVVTHAVWEAMQEQVMFAGLAFVFMSYVLGRTPVLDNLIEILNSMFGRLKGGPVYTTTVAAGAFGSVAHVGAAVTASVGAVTIPWMKRAKVEPEIAASVTAGCAGMGVTFPFSATMFILTGALATTGTLTTDELVVPLAIGGLWCLVTRLVVNYYLVRKHNLAAMDPSDLLPFRRSLTNGWTSLTLFIAMIIPVLMTMGWTGRQLNQHVDVDMGDAISLIVWIPVLMIAIVAFLGRKHLPRDGRGWYDLLAGAAPRFGVIGVTIVAAFGASNVLAEIGLPAALTDALSSFDAPRPIMAILVGVVVVAVAIPLTASATMAAIGPVAVMTLMSVGVEPAVAATAVLIFASTEGASPPSGAPIYVAAGLADVDPARMFRPLITYFCLPILGIGVLIASGVLPV